MAKPSVTSADVARLARVSQSAVSRTFTRGASVSEDTRSKVMVAAKQLGYRPNALARSLISGRSGIIGIAVAYLDNQFYPVVIERLSRALQVEGYHTLLFMTDPGDQDKVVQEILQYQVEGVVMASAHLSSSMAQECADHGIPVVLFNRYVSSTPASSVTSDNIAGGRAVGRFLAQGGHERIAFIAGFELASTSRDREAGFYQGLAEEGMVCHARAVGAYTSMGATDAARELFSRKDKPDAVFVANDHMAFAVMDVLRNDLGLRIPQDVSVVGYDDVPQAAWGAYDLTTVEQPADAMIAATKDILLEQIAAGAVSRRASVLHGELIIRGSARTG
ncbi:LacI family DNA-binding transcriptional regulator [Pseudahrensia aquimaris]|uniref:LacI family DNA-binding transcriptional regulator n=1 Tax=Pseudahrensia aquimaris TaxID=744461 RepID=A0ABW3FDW7_9HYPH